MSGGEEHLSHSPEETRALGEQLGRQLQPGEVVAFSGDLGAGKTCMIQGVCAGLGIADQVNSPTFILINEYVGRASGQEVAVYHFDLYRLRSERELEALGAEEYFYGQGICLIEWPERAHAALPPRRREVVLEHCGPQSRRIVCRTLSPPHPQFPDGQ
ncbi:MAG: tRNA (adenosine(37)-N6)-threonylcarbamoyltransferase complex ATPase subunit type 1 TsaE [Candidatus Latescibacteria bacterium]|nr:tRNA (adenosine(37)-N6)-threonylcarbamoyltransferase complex ATPase subunit type 1 TsaE [Candidatus Latescibacterota bacterium]